MGFRVGASLGWPSVTDTPWWRKTIGLLREAAASFGHDRAGRMGAALAFSTVFSLVPMLFLASAVAGFLLGDPGQLARVVGEAERVVGPQVGGQIERILARVAETAGASLGVGLVLVALAGSSVFLQLQASLSDIFGVAPRRFDGVVGFLVQRAVAAAAVAVFAALMLVPVVAVGAVRWLVRLMPDPLGMTAVLVRLLVPVVSLALLVAVVAVSFQWFTTAHIPWRAALRGAAFTAGTALLAAASIGAYLGRVVGSSQTPSALGLLGGVAVLLFFFNLMWQVYLFGAEVTKAWLGPASPPRDPEGPPPSPEPGPVVWAFLLGLLMGWWVRKHDRGSR